MAPFPETAVSRAPDSRSAASIGFEWSARVTTIGLEFAVPALLGRGLDLWLATSPAFTVGGAVLGMAIGMYHILRLPQELRDAERRRRPPGEDAAPGPRLPG